MPCNICRPPVGARTRRRHSRVGGLPERATLAISERYGVAIGDEDVLREWQIKCDAAVPRCNWCSHHRSPCTFERTVRRSRKRAVGARAYGLVASQWPLRSDVHLAQQLLEGLIFPSVSPGLRTFCQKSLLKNLVGLACSLVSTLTDRLQHLPCREPSSQFQAAPIRILLQALRIWPNCPLLPRSRFTLLGGSWARSVCLREFHSFYLKARNGCSLELDRSSPSTSSLPAELLGRSSAVKIPITC